MSAANLINAIGSLLIIIALSGDIYAQEIPEPTNSTMKCRRNEVFNDCIICGYQPVCNVSPPGILCDICVPGCVCKAGFIRLTRNGRCVCFRRCPRTATTFLPFPVARPQ